MKKFIIAIAAIFIAYSAQAQIGVFAGLTSSKIDLESAVADIENVNQFHVGVAYKLSLGNLFAVQPAIRYNVKGTKIDEVSSIKDFEIEAETGYIEVPVQLQVGFGVGPIARVFAFAEPYVGYAVSNKVDMDLFNFSTDINDKWDLVESRFNYGLGLGVGAEVFKHLQVSVKYFWDMGDMYDLKVVEEKKCNGVAASVAFFF